MKRYAIAGASSRGITMYAVPMSEKYKDDAEIVGVYDPNKKRAQILKNKAGGDFPVYDSFEAMLACSKPDIVIVTTVDRYHHEYIIKALEAGCDAITEKPMTIDAEKCDAILETEKRTGKRVIVTFNARCCGSSTKMKEIIKSGTIGAVLCVHFEWLLDTVHGADYFRRWHRRMENSGGLLIHKATHHFDMMNWLIEQDPEVISAFGTRRFYGPTRNERGERCLNCKYKGSCKFYFDIMQPGFKELYFDCEGDDGYIRDKCVFSEEIDIYDSMTLNVSYSGGAIMSYSLIAHSPYEGYRLVISGTEGRLELEDFSTRTPDANAGFAKESIKVYNRQGDEIIVKVPELSGEHGGGDGRLQKVLFKEGEPDPFGYAAGSRSGAMSVIIGAAANKSINEKRTVFVKELLKNL